MPSTPANPIHANGFHVEPQSRGDSAAPASSTPQVPGPQPRDHSVPSVLKSPLLDDYVCAELSPRAVAVRHNIDLQELVEWAASQNTDAELNRLEQFSLRRARVIAALMRPQALENLYQCMQSAPPGSDLQRRAATALIRASNPPRLISGCHCSPPVPRREQCSTPSPSVSPPRPCPPHRMSEFLSEAEHIPSSIDSALSPNPPESHPPQVDEADSPPALDVPVCEPPIPAVRELPDESAPTELTSQSCRDRESCLIDNAVSPTLCVEDPPRPDSVVNPSPRFTRGP